MKINIKLSEANHLKLNLISDKMNKDKSKILKPYLFHYLEYDIEKNESYGFFTIQYQIMLNEKEYNNTMQYSVDKKIDIVEMIEIYINAIIQDIL